MSLFDIKEIEKARFLISEELAFLQCSDATLPKRAWLHFYEKSEKSRIFRDALVRIAALLGSVELLSCLPKNHKTYDAVLAYSGNLLRDARFSVADIHNPLSWFKMSGAWETFASAFMAAKEASGSDQNKARELIWMRALGDIDLYRAMVKIGCTSTHNILIVTDDHSSPIGKLV